MIIEDRKDKEYEKEIKKDNLSQLMAEYASEIIYVKIAPKDIDIFNKYIEAYDNMALVTTVDPKCGKVALWVTEDTKGAVSKIITKLPCDVHLWSDELSSVLD